MKNFLRLAAALLLVALFGRVDVSAQVVTTQPEVITQDTKNVVITFHADWGNRGMVGLSSSAAVYAHTGVITDKSKSNQDWLYCTSNWNTPQAKFKMTYAGPNLWTLTIPDIREWYGVPEGETIEKLTFVFHATSGTKPEGKTLMGGDIYLTLFPENFPQPKEEAYPGGTPKLGVTPNADGSATFCFVAPDKKSVVLRGSWNDYALVGSQQMNYTDFGGNRYFWCTVPGVANGQNQTYYYLVDGQIEVGDPYAHLVLDYENDKTIPASVFPDMPAYPARLVATPTIPLAVFNSTESDYAWEVTDFQGPDRSDLVIYEMLVRDFTGTENAARGDGTIEKAIAKLDYLKNLGVNAVELLPIMEFSGNQSWGYNPNFYLAPDKAYGTPDAYRRFIDECHKRGMAVILDIVFNHVTAVTRGTTCTPASPPNSSTPPARPLTHIQCSTTGSRNTNSWSSISRTPSNTGLPSSRPTASASTSSRAWATMIHTTTRPTTPPPTSGATPPTSKPSPARSTPRVWPA